MSRKVKLIMSKNEDISFINYIVRNILKKNILRYLKSFSNYYLSFSSNNPS